MSALVDMSRRRVAARTGLDAPVERNGQVCISETQRKVHMTAEALALLVAVPFTAYLALKPSDRLEPWERTGLGALALGTAVVDGALLYNYWRKRKDSR